MFVYGEFRIRGKRSGIDKICGIDIDRTVGYKCSIIISPPRPCSHFFQMLLLNLAT
jgi:hypothetical protein